MRPAVVQLVDLGLDWSFDQSMALTQSLIQSINVDWKHPAAEVEFIRTGDLDAVAAALADGGDITHVMSHSSRERNGGGAAFVSDDGQTALDLDDLAPRVHDRESPLAAAVLFADCCNSSANGFQRAIRDKLGQPVGYLRHQSRRTDAGRRTQQHSLRPGQQRRSSTQWSGVKPPAPWEEIFRAHGRRSVAMPKPPPMLTDRGQTAAA